MNIKYEIKRLNERLDSHSKRIKNLHRILSNIKSNQEHYQRVRLPAVLKREKARIKFVNEFQKATHFIKTFRKNFNFSSNSKNRTLRKQRAIGLFTPVEMQRLRRFLNHNHQYDYFFNYTNNPILKGKTILFLTSKEKQRLKYLIRKRRT